MASQVKDLKRVPGTNFVVDGFNFRYGPFVRRFFLTHTHSDHTIGLTKGFDQGYIYCSEVAARLLIYDMGVRRDVIRPLKVDCTVMLEGVAVTPISANHCPGSVCFLFEMQDGKRILHTGDFRWSDELHGRHPLLMRSKIDTVMLDTTYCDKKWVFPRQEDVVDALARHVGQCISQTQKKTLFVFQSYHIGKERAYFGVAERCNLNVYANPNKKKVLNLLDLPDSWMKLLVDDPDKAQIHIGTMKHQRYPESLQEDIKSTPWAEAVIVRPTGWTYRGGSGSQNENILSERRVCQNVSILSVCYSEHSSFEELQSCVRTLKPKKIIPTVNAETPEKSAKLVDKLCGLMDLSSDKSRIDLYLNKRASVQTGTEKEKQNDDPTVNLDDVDIREQEKIWDSLVSKKKKAKIHHFFKKK